MLAHKSMGFRPWLEPAAASRLVAMSQNAISQAIQSYRSRSLTELLAELVFDVGLIHAIWSEIDVGIDFDEWKITADDR